MFFLLGNMMHEFYGGGKRRWRDVHTGREHIADVASQYIGRNETDDIDLIKNGLRTAA